MKYEYRQILKDVIETLEKLAAMPETASYDDKKRRTFTELMFVINNTTEKSLVNRIPKELIETFETHSDKSYNYSSYSLSDLSDISKTFMSMIYLAYWCDSEEEQEEIISQWVNNQKMHDMAQYEKMMFEEDD